MAMKIVYATLVLALFASGCADKKPEVVAPNAAAQTAAPTSDDSSSANTAQTDVGKGGGAPVPVSPNLSVSGEIARACHLEAARATPEFAFDSASIGDEDRVLLGALAKCMSEGALRGKSVELTGRTDPRGETEYNMSLGESRADSVRRYLHDLGVADARLRSTSRGEIDAVGTDEPTWSHDRRVDIDLVN
jgi:peptidoglycan-associated lipoprotein